MKVLSRVSKCYVYAQLPRSNESSFTDSTIGESVDGSVVIIAIHFEMQYGLPVSKRNINVLLAQGHVHHDDVSSPFLIIIHGHHMLEIRSKTSFFSPQLLPGRLTDE